jgi:DNA polymerase III subunit delta'
MSFKGVVGQDQACRVLASGLESGRAPHAYLFAGPEGVGKRTAALRWAMALNCGAARGAEACGQCVSCRKIAEGTHPDVISVGFEFQARLLDEPADKQKTIKIDTLREMERALRLKPQEGRAKVALLDPADRLGEDAAHALLKILEEPPPGTHLVLLAQDPGQVLGTLRSRCQWVRFRPLPAELLADRLSAERPGEPEEKVRAAALAAEGSMGRALELLEGEEALPFDWETSPLSELLAWTEQFRGRQGREAAEDFLRRLLARFQGDLPRGGAPAKPRRVLEALEKIKRNVSPQLALEVLLLKLRWEMKAKA